MNNVNPLKILVFYGGDAGSQPRDALLAWLRGPHVRADARIVADDIPHSDGSVDERVDQAIAWADGAIAILTPDPRLPNGAPNVIDEIGRWRGKRSKETLLLIRHKEVKSYSNHDGLVYVSFKDKVGEAFEGIRRFLSSLSPSVRPSEGARPHDAGSISLDVAQTSPLRKEASLNVRFLDGVVCSVEFSATVHVEASMAPLLIAKFGTHANGMVYAKTVIETSVLSVLEARSLGDVRKSRAEVGELIADTARPRLIEAGFTLNGVDLRVITERA